MLKKKKRKRPTRRYSPTTQFSLELYRILRKFEETGDKFCRDFVIAFLYSRIANIIHTIGHTDYTFRIDNLNYNPEDALQDIAVSMIRRISRKVKDSKTGEMKDFSHWINPKDCEPAIYKLLILKFKDWIVYETRGYEQRKEFLVSDSEVNLEEITIPADNYLLDMYFREQKKLRMKILRYYTQPYYLKCFFKKENGSSIAERFLECINVGKEIVDKLCKSPDITIEKEDLDEIAKKYDIKDRVRIYFIARFYQYEIRKYVDKKTIEMQ